MTKNELSFGQLTAHLEVALRYNNFDEAKEWIERGADINSCYTYLRLETVKYDGNIEEVFEEIHIFSLAIYYKDCKLLNFILNNGYVINVFDLSKVLHSNNIEIIKLVFDRYKEQRSGDSIFSIFDFVYEGSLILLYIKRVNEIKLEIIDYFLSIGEDINKVTTINDKSTTVLDEVGHYGIIKDLRKRGAKTYAELYEKGKTE